VGLGVSGEERGAEGALGVRGELRVEGREGTWRAKDRCRNEKNNCVSEGVGGVGGGRRGGEERSREKRTESRPGVGKEGAKPVREGVDG
jgi:hypothetical protein